MRVINSIAYNPELGFRGLGDLYLPAMSPLKQKRF